MNTVPEYVVRNYESALKPEEAPRGLQEVRQAPGRRRSPPVRPPFPPDDEAPTRGPAQDTVSFCAVRLTGTDADPTVRFVSRPDAIKTRTPPTPTTDVFGTVMGT